MKPKKPLPTGRPFLTIFTCTYQRPKGLEACLKSVARQTLAHEIEHIVLPDHVGVAPNDAVYGRLPKYVDAVHGEYVHVLGDDDVLADDRVVERLKRFAERNFNPPVIVLKCKKGEQVYPKTELHGTIKEGDIDLCCLVIRQDVWAKTISEYAPDYKCDWDYFELVSDGWDLENFNCLFAQGAVGGGRPEAVDW